MTNSGRSEVVNVVSPIEPVVASDELKKPIKGSALAFRGYEERNFARSAELLDEFNNRAVLADWTDHPQRLWEAMKHALASGVELVCGASFASFARFLIRVAAIEPSLTPELNDEQIFA